MSANRPMRNLLAFISVSILLISSACASSTTPAPATSAPAATATSAGPCPCLKVHVMPEAGVKVISDAIDGAQKSIKLKMYLFTEPKVTEALRRAAARQVDTRVLMELQPYGGSAGNVDIFNALKGSGVQWKWTDFNSFKYTHEKSMVIDDQLAYILTYNFTSSAFTANREYGVVDSNPADVAEVIRVFEADWNRTQPDLNNASLVWSPVNARQKILALIDAARASLDAEQEEFLDEEVGSHLLSAIQRGVKLRVVSSPIDPLDKDLNEAQRDQLRRAGAQVRYLNDPFVHAKLYLVDGKKAFVGSENNSTNSLNNNRELGIIFDEAEPVKVLAATFEQDFALATTDPFPVSDAPIPPNGIVNWKDATKYYNRTVTIEGKVVETYNSGRVIFLNLGPNREQDVKVVIFPSDWGKFPSTPDKLYEGKTIRVTGKVEKYQGAPEIKVNDPKAIVVVNP